VGGPKSVAQSLALARTKPQESTALNDAKYIELRRSTHQVKLLSDGYMATLTEVSPNRNPVLAWANHLNDHPSAPNTELAAPAAPCCS
jgi:hypothetical protein